MAEICYKKNLLSFLPLIDGNVIFIKKIPNFSHPLMIMQIPSSMHNRTKVISALRITSTTFYGISLKCLISYNLFQKLLIRFAYGTHQNKGEMADASLQFCFAFVGLPRLGCAKGKIQHKSFMLVVDFYCCNTNETSGPLLPPWRGRILWQSLQFQQQETSNKKLCYSGLPSSLSNDRRYLWLVCWLVVISLSLGYFT